MLHYQYYFRRYMIGQILVALALYIVAVSHYMLGDTLASVQNSKKLVSSCFISCDGAQEVLCDDLIESESESESDDEDPRFMALTDKPSFFLHIQFFASLPLEHFARKNTSRPLARGPPAFYA